MCAWIGLSNMTRNLVQCTDYVRLDWFEQHDTKLSAVYTDYVLLGWFEKHDTKLSAVYTDYVRLNWFEQHDTKLSAVYRLCALGLV